MRKPVRRVAPPPRCESALILFAKAPVPGQVKTRLCPPLTPDEAASLHGSFVLDALEHSRGLRGVDRFLACAPSKDHVFFQILAERHGVGLADQMGPDLGARMNRSCADAFAAGYRKVVLVGTDLPTLPARTPQEAFTLLDSHDLILGPALDGGYYLIGLTRPAPELFADIPWSTPRVLAMTQAKADAIGLHGALLPTCRDIDTVDDLKTLIAEEGLAPRETSAPTSKPSAPASRLSRRTAGTLRLIAERLAEREGRR